MKKAITYKFIYNNNYDICEYRLSPTSRAFCEKNNTGSEWYELTPEFNFEKMGILSSQDGEILLTSPKSFIKPLYLTFNFSYNELEKEWEKIVIEVKEKECSIYKKEKWVEYAKGRSQKVVEEIIGYKNKPLVVKEIPDDRTIRNMIINYYKNKYTKLIPIYDNGEYVFNLRAKKEQKFSFEEISGVDNFKEFEEFVKKFYKLNDYSLILPEESENSPIHHWEEKYPQYKKYLKKVDGYTFIENSFFEEIEKKEEENRKKAGLNLLKEAIEKKSLWKLELVKRMGVDETKIKKAEAIIIAELKKEIENNLYEIKENLPNIADFEEEYIEVKNKAGKFIAKKGDKIWNVKVPNNLKGLFIGKKGANIKELAQKYNVKINII